LRSVLLRTGLGIKSIFHASLLGNKSSINQLFVRWCLAASMGFPKTPVLSRGYLQWFSAGRDLRRAHAALGGTALVRPLGLASPSGEISPSAWGKRRRRCGKPLPPAAPEPFAWRPGRSAGWLQTIASGKEGVRKLLTGARAKIYP